MKPPDDISEQAREAIRQSEERYRNLFARMNEGFALHELIYDAEGRPCDYRFLEVNPAFERATGLKAADLVGRTLHEVFPDNEPVWFQRYARVAISGEPDHFEDYHRQTGRWYEIYASRTAPGQFAVVFLNVTERKQAEEALRNAQDLLRGVLNATPMLVACMDREFNFLLVNRAYARADDRVPEFFPGKNHFALYPNAENEAIFRQVVASGEPYHVFAKSFEYPNRASRGVTYWDWSIVPIRDAAGRVDRLVMTLLDVTPQVRAEEELRESEERFRALVHASSEALYRMSPDWSELRQLHSRGFLTDVDRPERNWLQEYIPPEDQPQVSAAFEKAIRSKGVFELEHRVLQADGRLGWVASRAVPVRDAAGEILEWFGAASNITDRKQAEADLRQAKAAAEAANDAKSRLLANMSHEVRTPMNAVLGMIDVALPKAMDPTVQDCLETARGSADLLLALLNDLLDSAKIESNKLELESAPFSLRRMLDQVMQILSVRADEKGLRLACRMPKEAPDALIGVRTRVPRAEGRTRSASPGRRSCAARFAHGLIAHGLIARTARFAIQTRREKGIATK